MTAENLLLALPLTLVGEQAKQRPNRPMDEAKFDAFYRATAASLWSYIHRLTSDAAAADDLLQKTFFRFLRAKPTFESDEHVRRWVYRTATNLAFDHFREIKRSSGTAGLDRPVTQPVNSDLRQDMKRVFSELKPRERALLYEIVTLRRVREGLEGLDVLTAAARADFGPMTHISPKERVPRQTPVFHDGSE